MRRSDTIFGDAKAAEPADRAGDAGHGPGGDPGRDASERHGDVTEGNCSDGGGHKDAGERDGDGVCGQADDGGAMEIVGHRQNEAALHQGGNTEYVVSR